MRTREAMAGSRCRRKVDRLAKEMRKTASKAKDHRTGRRSAAKQARFVVLTVGREGKHIERKKRGTGHG
jgi:hypothetical protein